MVDTTIRNPSKDSHFARIKPVGRRVRVKRDGAVIADSRDAVWLQETSRDVYDPVLYMPRGDVGANLETVAGKSTHCPLKGDAAYLTMGGFEVAWTYDRPLESAAVLKDLIAFDPNVVTFEIVGPRA